MSSFTEAWVSPVRGEKHLFYVVRSFRWYFGYVGSTLFVDIPIGFQTDLISGPRWLIRLIPKRWKAKMVAPAIVHDRLREDQRFDKVAGDIQFFSALLANGVPRFLAVAALVAVLLNKSRTIHNA